MAVRINAHRLLGPWSRGYALDVHTLSSTLIGYNAFGHKEFATVRSSLGELLYRLKNRGDETVIPEIVDTAATFVTGWGVLLDALVPLKDVFDFAKRTELLDGAFAVDATKTTGKRLLLLDDLYRSGATVSAITTLLLTMGAASAVYLLTLTQTRKLA